MHVFFWFLTDLLLTTFVEDFYFWSGVNEDSLQKPGNPKTNQDVKYIAANGIANSHVSVTLPYNCNPWESIWNTDSCGDEGEAHHRVRNTKCEANHCDHPNHDIGVQTDPKNTAEEGQDKPEND